MTRSREAWLEFLAARLVGMGVDTAVMAAAYVGAFALRLDFEEPSWGWPAVARSFLTVWVVKFASLFVTGCYALSWRRVCTRHLPRYAGAVLLGGAVLTAMRLGLPSLASASVRPPYSITIIDMVLWGIGLVSVRYLWRFYKMSVPDEADLLDRVEAQPDAAEVVEMLRGACVMVTGAGGSIGGELVRQIVRNGPRKVLLVERSESALYEIDREIRQLGANVQCVPEMVDIADEPRMAAIFAENRPSIVLHAAAYKHVPMVEANPREGIRNNTLATRRLGEMAAAAGVARFVMISTDKAVNPVGVMGATKRMAEIVLMDLNGAAGGTRFSAVRFGNVLGSSGSVVPLFREQIARRLPLTITHPDMKRYFMTVQEAVGLVLQAAASARGGEVFVLDMGQPVKIVDLAEKLIRQAGCRPYVDVPIRFTGIRPGEKLFEELDVSEKSAFKTGHARIFVCRNAQGDAPGVLALARDLVSGRFSEEAIRDRLGQWMASCRNARSA
ncbi:MAG: polysaccharide biosynthesis protein [Kiritimatiellia bacterium]